MDRSTIDGAAARLAGRFGRALVLTGVLMASQAAATPVAFAATHHGRSHGARRAGARAQLVWSWSAWHASAASAPRASAASGSTTTSGPCADATLVPTGENLPLIAAATLCLVNQQRVLHGERPLNDDANLDRSATHHSQDMITANYYDHTSPTGETALDRIEASGYVPQGYGYEIGENIDLGGGTFATPAAIVEAWMNSTGHRENILNPDFVDTGIGVVAQVPAEVASSQIGATYTQDFGSVQSPDGAIS